MRLSVNSKIKLIVILFNDSEATRFRVHWNELQYSGGKEETVGK